MNSTPPIATIHLFPVLDAMLIKLLQSLGPGEWKAPTVAGKWTVKDIAAHLLDGNLRTISLVRDNHALQPQQPIQSYQQLLDFLNAMNAEWVQAFRRVSTPVLTELLAVTGTYYCECLEKLDPYADAVYSVAWAGESVSKNWFHIAREYTEKFHHQQQIREATGRPGIFARDLYYPFIDTLMKGLPHTFRNLLRPELTTVQVTITGEPGGNWYLVYRNGNWHLGDKEEGEIKAVVTLDPDAAWKIFTKRTDPAAARSLARIQGDPELANNVLQMVAVMA